jgi:predicted Rossmann fold flavoprotein
MYDLIVIGGGAAGIFAANAAKTINPAAKVCLLEKTAVLLAKVRISGGGRCNVTHACFDPLRLIQNYPRGGKELLGPFHRFQPQDTIEWFESRGVKLKTEPDGRMFPITDRSESIIDCLLLEAKQLEVEILLRQKIERISKCKTGFEIFLKEGNVLEGRSLLLATGSSLEGYQWAQSLGHTIQEPVPSLFTFNVPTSPLKVLSGIALDPVQLKILGTSFSQTDPLLITHFGFSGPAALKLSAWAARYLFEKEYKVELMINWAPRFSKEEVMERLLKFKTSAPQKNLLSENLFELPKSLWKMFLEILGHNFTKRINDISTKDLQTLAKKIHEDCYQVEGKTTNKEEFVTCGGVTLKEVDFKTMQSKVCPALFFAGEILDIDGVTGGFNFQNAWTTGFIAGTSSVSLSL